MARVEKFAFHIPTLEEVADGKQGWFFCVLKAVRRRNCITAAVRKAGYSPVCIFV